MALSNIRDTRLLEILVDNRIDFNKHEESISGNNKKYFELIGKSAVSFDNFLNLTILDY